MAASITHLVVGERVFKQIAHLDPTQAIYGSFLAGCILVDVHAFHAIDRDQTHFSGRFDEPGKDAFNKSCANFLRELDNLLHRPWDRLDQTEQAFVAGYLCHLAADELWKELGQQLFRKLNITHWTDFPVPPDVSLTVFGFLSRQMLIDPASAFTALQAASIPDVFRHVPQETFCRQWNVIREYVLDGATIESYGKMLEYAGRSNDQIQQAKQQHIAYWKNAIELYQSLGGVQPFIQDATARSLAIIPQLWLRSTGDDRAN
jgi:hypothetical protein